MPVFWRWANSSALCFILSGKSVNCTILRLIGMILDMVWMLLPFLYNLLTCSLCSSVYLVVFLSSLGIKWRSARVVMVLCISNIIGCLKLF